MAGRGRSAMGPSWAVMTGNPVWMLAPTTRMKPGSFVGRYRRPRRCLHAYTDPHTTESDCMTPAPIPANDAERLRALRELLILDTPPEERFDRLVEFAASEFDMPIVLISLIDSERQWFKARVGMAACETSRDISFCGHAILQHELFQVMDALADPRFADNPLVVGDPFIRFYIGAPLTLPGGATVGTLCLIDTKPREFDAMDRAILGTLRDLAIAELTGQAGAGASA